MPLLPPIDHATVIAAPPERCFDAFATPEGLDAWFTRGARVEARAGGRIRFRWVDWGPDRLTLEDEGRVAVAERPHRFSFFWHVDPEDVEGTLVELTFTSMGAGTVVRVRETGYPDTPEGLRGCLECATGWGEALTLAKMWLEHGIATHRSG